MRRFFLAMVALLGLVGPLAVNSVRAAVDHAATVEGADGRMMHCEMQTAASDADGAVVSDSPDCCRDGCDAPSCCRLMAPARLLQTHLITKADVLTATLGFSALPDAPRAAHTPGIERPPKA